MLKTFFFYMCVFNMIFEKKRALSDHLFYSFKNGPFKFYAKRVYSVA